MDLNYIIITHSQPELLARLVRSLQVPQARFYVHVDRKVPVKPFTQAIGNDPSVYFIPDEQRLDMSWGDVNLVHVTLALLKTIINEGRKGYCILLSGQDYPIKSNAHITAYLENNDGINFIRYGLLPWYPDGGLERINRYKVDITRKRGNYVLLPSVWEKEFYSVSAMKKLIRLFRSGRTSFLPALFRKRSFPAYLKPYAGDTWWALPVETINMIFDFIDKHPDFLLYHQYTLLPDEVFFQALILKLFEGREDLIHSSVTYVNWTKQGVTLPVTFTQTDLDELISQPAGKLFARKFDGSMDTRILDLLDEYRFAGKKTYSETL